MTGTEKYSVIGGQYAPYCYGTTDSLPAAKRMATRNEEYWDHWQGWHTPAIYLTEDTEEYYNDFYKDYHRAPKEGATPLLVKYNNSWHPYEPY